jgi:hypothetical protein
VCLEGNFGFFSRGQPDLVIACSQVELREPARAREFVKQLINERQRILALNSKSIEMTVIHYKAPSWNNGCIGCFIHLLD